MMDRLFDDSFVRAAEEEPDPKVQKINSSDARTQGDLPAAQLPSVSPTMAMPLGLPATPGVSSHSPPGNPLPIPSMDDFKALLWQNQIMINQMIKTTSEAVAAANMAAAAAANMHPQKPVAPSTAHTEPPPVIISPQATFPSAAAEAQPDPLPAKQQQKIPAPLEKLLDHAGQKFEKEVRKYFNAISRAKKPTPTSPSSVPLTRWTGTPPAFAHSALQRSRRRWTKFGARHSRAKKNLSFVSLLVVQDGGQCKLPTGVQLFCRRRSMLKASNQWFELTEPRRAEMCFPRHAKPSLWRLLTGPKRRG